MKSFVSRRRGYHIGIAFGVVGLCFSSVVVLAQGMTHLTINGSPVTTDVRKIGGKTYIPVEDVAKALGMQVYASGDQITLRPAGGANQIANKTVGKVGEELFTGRYRFIVNSVQETQKYEMKYANGTIYKHTLEAAGNEKLIVLDCRLKNGTTVKDEFTFSTGDWGENTALTDTEESSHQPTDYDVAADETAPLGEYALPGAAVHFALIFRVNESVQPKDLVYTIVRYAERGKNKGTDVRVLLNP